MDGKFVRRMDNQNCKFFYHYIFKKSFVDNKANLLVPIGVTILKYSKIICKVAKNIMEYVNIESNNVFHDFKRTFKILCTHCHLTIISQNYV
jgi:hypothetical protein